MRARFEVGQVLEAWDIDEDASRDNSIFIPITTYDKYYPDRPFPESVFFVIVRPRSRADVKSAIQDGENRLNGHGRLLVRSSGTEPVIRVMGEGDDRILVEDVVDQIVNALGHVAAA